MLDVSASIVLFNTPRSQVEKVATCFLNTELDAHLFLVNNGAYDDYDSIASDKRVTYVESGRNVGYGRAHNIAMRKTVFHANYHVVLNPDIYFADGTIEKVHAFMQENLNVVHAMPRIVYPGGEMQYLCKLVPSPFDLLVRRFPLPFNMRLTSRFELRDLDYDTVCDVPYLSGCFMFLRCSALVEAGLFDERFFMYPEDIDLTRRLHEINRTVYYPGATVVHEHARESYRNVRMLIVHVVNIARYFNKWGWLLDPSRKRINRRILSKV